MSNKKGKRLVDVLGEEFNGATGEFLKAATEKFVRLFTRVSENSKMPKHNTDLKWCGDVIDKLGDGVIPSKSDLETANQLWKQYK